MPHFTIEYSANLDARVDMGAVVEIVRKAAVETGIFPLGGIRVRAIRCEHSAIADGRPDFGFLDMVLRLGEGRDLATRKKAGEHIFRMLSDHLDPVFAQSRSRCHSTCRSTTSKPAGSATTSTNGSPPRPKGASRNDEI
jgi:5-carboxymethyl-2-hydroxymuconate isomerase